MNLGSLSNWLPRRFWRPRYADFDRYTAEVNWLRSPLVVRLYINPQISGRADQGWLAWLREKYFAQPAGRGLSLGCGTGALERRAVELNLCRTLEACDLSPDAIAAAQADAERAGLADRLRFFVADLNAIALAPRPAPPAQPRPSLVAPPARTVPGRRPPAPALARGRGRPVRVGPLGGNRFSARARVRHRRAARLWRAAPATRAWPHRGELPG